MRYDAFYRSRAPQRVVKVGWTDEAREAAAAARSANHSNMSGGTGPDPHGPHLVTFHAQEVEHSGDEQRALDELAPHVKAAGGKFISVRPAPDSYETAEIKAHVKDLGKLRDAMNTEEMRGSGTSITRVDPLKRDGSLLPGKDHAEAVARLESRGYKVTGEGHADDNKIAESPRHTTTLKGPNGEVGRVTSQPGSHSIDDGRPTGPARGRGVNWGGLPRSDWNSGTYSGGGRRTS
jgi:hypothetical protein